MSRAVFQYRNQRCTELGEVLVTADGGVRVDSNHDDVAPGWLSPKDALAMARVILRRAMPGHAVVPKESLTNMVTELEEWCDQPEEGDG